MTAPTAASARSAASIAGTRIVMLRLTLVTIAAAVLSPRGAHGQPVTKTPRADCPRCAEWNRLQEPFRVFGNTWYVGTRGLSAVLITSSEGHVLIDGGLPESAPLIVRNVESLGFRMRDVKLIVNSHAHYDHAGGLAALQRASGATVAAHPWSAAVFARGESPPSDPQYGTGIPFPRLQRVQHVADGETLRVGPLRVTAHYTGGHTPGGTSWRWTSCEGARCVEVVYADSQNPVSADSFRFTGSRTYPSALQDFERGFAALEKLRCDVLITPHPEFSGLFEQRAKRDAGDASAFVQRGACGRYVESMRRRLAARLEQERSQRSR